MHLLLNYGNFYYYEKEYYLDTPFKLFLIHVFVVVLSPKFTKEV